MTTMVAGGRDKKGPGSTYGTQAPITHHRMFCHSLLLTPGVYTPVTHGETVRPRTADSAAASKSL